MAPDPEPAIICTVCGATYALPVQFTWDALRAQGYHVRRVHGRRGVPGRCPLHHQEDGDG